jgi:hypothetical protein
MVDDLILVSMHNGKDTASYVARGFRVVAIEANPGLVQTGIKRFSTAIPLLSNEHFCTRARKRAFWYAARVRNKFGKRLKCTPAVLARSGKKRKVFGCQLKMWPMNFSIILRIMETKER